MKSYIFRIHYKLARDEICFRYISTCVFLISYMKSIFSQNNFSDCKLVITIMIKIIVSKGEKILCIDKVNKANWGKKVVSYLFSFDDMLS